jgi:hypothetical protein
MSKKIIKFKKNSEDHVFKNTEIKQSKKKFDWRDELDKEEDDETSWEE